MKEKEKAKMIQLLKRESQKPDGLHRKPEDQVKIIIVNKRVNKAAIQKNVLAFLCSGNNQ